MSLLLAFADALNGVGDVLGKGNLQPFVGGDLAALLLLFVFLVEAVAGVEKRKSARRSVRNGAQAVSKKKKHSRRLVLFQLFPNLMLLGQGQPALSK